uniref:WD_REPEATS_REGION domain-containing protein n=1 Tax=Meloidogyne hapla TaxID=6305 RepID=A0A1I8BQU1_MELHA
MNGCDIFQKHFSNSYPEERDCTLDSNGAAATVSKFNRLGTLIAVGSTDGRIFIYEFVTKGVVKAWNAHVKPIISLSWSRNGKRLLSSSVDGSVAVWDVLNTTQPLHRLCFGVGSTTQCALFNPRNEHQVLVYLVLLNSSVCSPPIVKNLLTGQETRLAPIGSRSEAADEPISAAIFDRRGNLIITGSTKAITHCRQQGNQQQIKSFSTSRRNDYIITNSQDRVIRCYRLQDILNIKPGSTLQPIQRFQDIVNKTLWKCICTSGDGDYICGGSSKSHSLNIWERSTGALVKILHGHKGELLSDVQWHPNKSVIISVSAGTGTVTVWTQAHVENWSAFAPDFTELEENLKYVEKEGEFDTFDEDASDNGMETEKKEEDEINIDVTTVEAHNYLHSSDEEDLEDFSTDLEKGKSLWFVPVVPEIDLIEEETIKSESRPNSTTKSRNPGKSQTKSKRFK